MSVATTRPRIARLFNYIEGVTHPFGEIPHSIESVELPCSIVFAGEATYETDSEDIVVEKRIYIAQLYIAKMGEGLEGTVEIAADPFFDRVRDFLMARPGLEIPNDPNPQGVVYDATLLGDGGFKIAAYPIEASAARYAMIEWRLQVEEKANIAYAD